MLYGPTCVIMISPFIEVTCPFIYRIMKFRVFLSRPTLPHINHKLLPFHVIKFTTLCSDSQSLQNNKPIFSFPHSSSYHKSFESSKGK